MSDDLEQAVRVVDHAKQVLSDLRIFFPQARIMPKEKKYHLFPAGDFSFNINANLPNDPFQLRIQGDIEAGKIELDLMFWSAYLKQVQYTPETRVLADDGLVLYKKQTLVDNKFQAVLIANLQFVLKALVPENENHYLNIKLDNMEQLKPLLTILLNTRRQDEAYRMFRRELCKLNEEYPAVWRNPQPETDNVVEWYYARLALPTNNIKVHARCTMGRQYLEVRLFRWEKYIKVVKKRPGLPRDAGLVVVRTGPCALGLEDDAEFMAGGVHVCNGRVRGSRLILEVYDKEFRFFVDLLLNAP